MKMLKKINFLHETLSSPRRQNTRKNLHLDFLKWWQKMNQREKLFWSLKEFHLNDNSLGFFPQQLMFPFTLFTFAMQGLKIVMVASMPKNSHIAPVFLVKYEVPHFLYPCAFLSRE